MSSVANRFGSAMTSSRSASFHRNISGWLETISKSLAGNLTAGAVGAAFFFFFFFFFFFAVGAIVVDGAMIAPSRYRDPRLFLCGSGPSPRAGLSRLRPAFSRSETSFRVAILSSTRSHLYGTQRVSQDLY